MGRQEGGRCSRAEVDLKTHSTQHLLYMRVCSPPPPAVSRLSSAEMNRSTRKAHVRGELIRLPTLRVERLSKEDMDTGFNAAHTSRPGSPGFSRWPEGGGGGGARARKALQRTFHIAGTTSKQTHDPSSLDKHKQLRSGGEPHGRLHLWVPGGAPARYWPKTRMPHRVPKRARIFANLVGGFRTMPSHETDVPRVNEGTGRDGARSQGSNQAF